MIALMHSELSEWLEAIRKKLPVDYQCPECANPNSKLRLHGDHWACPYGHTMKLHPAMASEHIPEFTAEEEEAADIIVRVLDYSAGFRLRVAEALVAKMAFNETRPYRHGKTC